MSAKMDLSASQCVEMGRTCLCFGLRRATRAVTQIFNERLAEVGLTATQLTLLAVVRVRSGVSVVDLASHVVLEPSGLSRNLGVLRRRGLIALKPGPDRRTRLVSLTARGKTALGEAHPVWRKAQLDVQRALGKSARSDLLETLKTLAYRERPANSGAARARRARASSARARPGLDAR